MPDRLPRRPRLILLWSCEMSQDLQISVSATPNPNSRKFSWGTPIVDDGPHDFPTLRSAEGSPLASKLFKVNGVMAVFIANDFVSVNKHPGVGWDGVEEGTKEVIAAFAAGDEPAVLPKSEDEAEVSGDAIEAKIRGILDTEVRPAVAMDGGDIHFVAFSNGVLSLQLRGSCSGCPSSMQTLKHGVEARMKQMVPEVEEVVALM